jgi:hypothetical protein
MAGSAVVQPKGNPLRLHLAVVGFAAALAYVAWQSPSFAQQQGGGDGGQQQGGDAGKSDASESDAGEADAAVGDAAGGQGDAGAAQGDAGEPDASDDCVTQGGGQGQQQDNPNCPASGGSSGGCSIESTTLPDLGCLGIGGVCAATILASRRRRY